MKIYLELINREADSLSLRIIRLIYDIYDIYDNSGVILAFIPTMCFFAYFDLSFYRLPGSYSRNSFARVTRSVRVHAAN